jgi:AraC-like DNA-binding protein
MSKKCQTPFLDPRSDFSSQLTTLSYDYPANYFVPPHFHDADQLVFARDGVMTVHTDHGVWVVPPLRAVWIPHNVVHSIAMSGVVSMRTLYFAPRFVKSAPRNCSVINVSPLLRELILHACGLPRLSKRVAAERRVIDLIVDQFEASKAIPLQLPQPSDSRAKRVAEILIGDPADSRPLEEICKDCGAAKRTIERLFLQETAMTFGRWRQQLRLLHGLRSLALGAKVTSAALDAGYNSPSAFIAAFRKSMGFTPKRYYDPRN